MAVVNFLQKRVEKLALTIFCVLVQYRFRKGVPTRKIFLDPKHTLPCGVTYWLDSSGKKLIGTHRYTLRFEFGQYAPPPNTDWSLTIFALDGLSAISPPNHGNIDSSMLPTLQYDADGGLTIYIQADSPSKNLESNWLSPKDGQFMVTLQLFRNVPRPTTMVTWKAPSLRRTN